MQTPGQAHDQRDLVILANKKKVSELGIQKGLSSVHPVRDRAGLKDEDGKMKGTGRERGVKRERERE